VKERMLRVLMISAFLFATGFTIFIAVVETRSTLIAAGIGIGVIAATSAIQYILLGEWHPKYLFRNHDKD
jgi:hypothetical protein